MDASNRPDHPPPTNDPDDPEHPEFVAELQRLRDDRFRRGELMVEKLQALGYPISRRFMWDGFVSQAMQKVVLQWRPEQDAVSLMAKVYALARVVED